MGKPSGISGRILWTETMIVGFRVRSSILETTRLDFYSMASYSSLSYSLCFIFFYFRATSLLSICLVSESIFWVRVSSLLATLRAGCSDSLMPNNINYNLKLSINPGNLYYYMSDCNQKSPAKMGSLCCFMLALVCLFDLVSRALAVPPSFSTSLPDYKTGRLVFTLTSPASSNGFDTNTMSFVFA